MRNPVLSIAIVFALAVPGSAFAGDKNKSKGIEVQDYGFGVSTPVTSTRSDGGGATVGRVVSPTTKAPTITPGVPRDAASGVATGKRQ